MSVSTPPNGVWSEKIGELRKRLKMNQKAFADELGTTQSNVSKWEAGTYKPAPEMFMKLARLADGEVESVMFMRMGGVPESWYMEAGSGKTVPTAVAQDAVRQAEQKRVAELLAEDALADLAGDVRPVPLLRDAAAAGNPRAIEDTAIEQTISFPRPWLPRGGTLYAMRVKGDSMSPILLDGHIAIVDVSKRTPSKLVRRMVAASDKEGVTIKWLRKTKDIYSLVPQHVAPEYDPQYLEPHGEFFIVGEVVKWIGEPPPARKG